VACNNNYIDFCSKKTYIIVYYQLCYLLFSLLLRFYSCFRFFLSLLVSSMEKQLRIPESREYKFICSASLFLNNEEEK